jgi:hypothetical protein
MDAKVQWKVSPKVETLVDKIVECRQGLIACVKERNPYNRHLKTVSCDVYASPKLVELLSLSSLWKPCAEKSEGGEEEDDRRKSKVTHELVADFELFKLSRDQLIGDEVVRLVMTFDTSESSSETFYGNVELLS